MDIQLNVNKKLKRIVSNSSDDEHVKSYGNWEIRDKQLTAVEKKRQSVEDIKKDSNYFENEECSEEKDRPYSGEPKKTDSGNLKKEKDYINYEGNIKR